MTQPYLQKLVTGFLILAIAISTSALILSGSQSAGAPDYGEKRVEGGPPTVPLNAFVETLPAETAPLADAAEAPSPAPGNLTDALAKNLADELLANNPEGPSILEGAAGAFAPDIETLAQKFTNDRSTIREVVATDPTPLISEDDVKVLEQYTQGDVNEYLSEMQRIFNEGVLHARVSTLLEENPAEEAANVIEVVLGKTAADIKGLSVPRSLLDFHLAAVRMVTYSHDMLQLDGASDDPLRELIAFEQYSRRTEEALRGFKDEFQRFTASKKLSSGEPASTETSLLEFFFTVPRVHAAVFVPVLDPQLKPLNITSVADFFQKLYEWGKKIATEILKDRIVHRLVQQAIKWIQGGGKPQFITNWRGFLKDAANEAAGDVLQRIAPQLCQGFGPLIRIAFQPVTSVTRPVTCTLDQVVRNVRNFYNDFSQGGWIAYGASLQPQNNLFGVIALTGDLVAQKTAEAKKAAENEARASSGFLSQKTCSQKKIVNQYRDCLAGYPDNPEACVGEPDVDQEVCVAYRTTTPGETLANITHDALSAPLQRIVNAQDLAALFSALINSALDKLFKLRPTRDGQPGLLGLQFATSSLTDACSDLTGRARDECLKALRGVCAGLTGEALRECLELIDGVPPPGGNGFVECDNPPETTSPNPRGVMDQVRSEQPWSDLDLTDESEEGRGQFTAEVARRLNAEDSNWGRKKSGSGAQVSTDTLGYLRPDIGPDRFEAVDIVVGDSGALQRGCYGVVGSGQVWVAP